MTKSGLPYLRHFAAWLLFACGLSFPLASGAVSSDDSDLIIDGVPMLWIYGRDDTFYSMAHSRQTLEIFRRAGGQARFVDATVQGENNGHGCWRPRSLPVSFDRQGI